MFWSKWTETTLFAFLEEDVCRWIHTFGKHLLTSYYCLCEYLSPAICSLFWKSAELVAAKKLRAMFFCWVHCWPTFLDQRGIQCIPPSPLLHCVLLCLHQISLDIHPPLICYVVRMKILKKSFKKTIDNCRGYSWWVLCALADESERHLSHGRQWKSATRPPTFSIWRWEMPRWAIHQQNIPWNFRGIYSYL